MLNCYLKECDGQSKRVWSLKYDSSQNWLNIIAFLRFSTFNTDYVIAKICPYLWLVFGTPDLKLQVNRIQTIERKLLIDYKIFLKECFGKWRWGPSSLLFQSIEEIYIKKSESQDLLSFNKLWSFAL
jgi:hypothetical protein